MGCSPVQRVVLSAKCFAQMTSECFFLTQCFQLSSLFMLLLVKESMLEVLDTITDAIFSKITHALWLNM